MIVKLIKSKGIRRRKRPVTLAQKRINAVKKVITKCSENTWAYKYWNKVLSQLINDGLLQISKRRQAK